MGRGIDIGIHADCDRGDEAGLARHLVDPLEFLLRLNIEAVDPLTQGIVDLSGGFTHTRKGAPVGATPGLEHAEKLPSRDDVESGPLLGEKVQHREIAVCLHRVADHPIAEGRKCRIKTAVIVQDRLRRVDIDRSTHLGGHGLQIDPLALQRAIGVTERMHRQRLKGEGRRAKGQRAGNGAGQRFLLTA